MRRFFRNMQFCFLFLFGVTAFANGTAVEDLRETSFLPLIDEVFGNPLVEEGSLFPRNFRTAQDNIQEDINELSESVRLDGLEELRVAGTAQFTEPQLLEILNHLGKKTLVVDLREETHLIFEDAEGKQTPITAFKSQNTGNVGKSYEEINEEIDRYKEFILNQEFITLYYTRNSEVQIDEKVAFFEVGNVYAEWESIERISALYSPGVEYLHFPVTDHKNPNPQAVDAFLSLLNSIKDDQEIVLLFHCKAGRGRTGVFMIMKDMIENAKRYHLSFEEILKRQELLGSPDFSKIKPGRAENSIERYEFLLQFYEFVIAEDGLEAGTPYRSWGL